jgi:DNA-binding CsgD family transcriptional regulator
VGDWPFVGRAEEREEVLDLLRRTPPVGVVLGGEQGVGKTRLAARIREEASAAGIDVRHAIAGPATTGIPFGALAALLPVLREIADTPQPALRAAARHLIDEAAGDALLISVDDAHHLDEASVALLQLIAPAPEVTVLLTVRTGGAGADPVQAIWRTGLVERIDLGPLSPAEVGQVLTMALGGPVSAVTVDTLSQLSGGNPLYLRELVLGSRQQGTLTAVDGLWHLSAPAATPRLKEIVEDRLRTLQPDERHALELVAVAGTIGYRQLVDLAGDEAVETLEREALIAVHSEGRRRIVGIGHPVHAEVVGDRLTTRRSMQLNRRIADALEATGAHRRDDVLRIATMRLEAGGEVSATLMTEAARRALAAYDLVLGERMARVAFETGGGLPAGLDLGGALTRLGRHREAATVFESIDTSGVAGRDRALVAMEWAECLFWGLHETERARTILDGALHEVGEPEWRDQIVATGATYALLEGRPIEALELVARIREEGSSRGVTAAGLTTAPALAMVGRGTEALADIDRGLAARQDMTDEVGLVYEGMLVMARCVALTELGRIREALELGMAGHAASVEATVEYAQAWFAMATGRACLLGGRLDEADRWFREGAARYDDISVPANRRWCLYGSGWALALEGDVDASRRMIERARAIGTSPVVLMEPETRRAEAALALAGGDTRQAVATLLAAADLAADHGLATQEAAALHDLVRAGVTAHVDRLVDVAAGLDGDLAACYVIHGRAARQRDGDGLGAVAEAFAGLGAELYAAEAAARAAAAHEAAGDRRAAARWTTRATALSAADLTAGNPTLQVGPTTLLTPREHEIAALAAGGHASKDIARTLSLSRRTVDNHLHRAYQKLGVQGREALAETLAELPE